MRYEVASLIISPSNVSLDFTARLNRLKVAVDTATVEEVLKHLDYAGVIPECFGRDSSEEMLYAKYCQALLARALRELGLKARSILDRVGAADVSANGDDYSIVGNAKAFRLSWHPKHQKDFNVEGLHKWRKGANFACLVCRLYLWLAVSLSASP
jgi:type II restriction enzyme